MHETGVVGHKMNYDDNKTPFCTRIFVALQSCLFSSIVRKEIQFGDSEPTTVAEGVILIVRHLDSEEQGSEAARKEQGAHDRAQDRAELLRAK